ncbi:MAG: Carbapenem-hydrolyzing beta-lactamase BlaB-1 precursor [Chloroflexi bacterium ADurb.Bin360]|nr:MAG: Carbapenem-hydrolyzing beta-lactamase BlaB-1 precursor [Chloroflexi bacterium ADurb.Bin360]
MFWERVTEEIYIFTSERYALVNCVALVTEEGVVAIDALPFPEEARQIAQFLDLRGRGRFHSLILTHYHMDHVYGLYAYPQNLDIIAHELCRRKLLDVGEASLQQARASDPLFDEVTLRIPTITFEEGELQLVAGDKAMRLMPLPGHTDDNVGVFLEEERILITGDSVMAIPIIADGDWRQAIVTLQQIKKLAPETIVQGHGEVILRGEVQAVLDRYINYLECVEEQARKVIKRGKPRQTIWDIPLETCGLERVPLGIASHQLHVANILTVYDRLRAEQEAHAVVPSRA